MKKWSVVRVLCWDRVGCASGGGAGCGKEERGTQAAVESDATVLEQ